MDPRQRRGIRYEGHDYSMAGYYALTICARDKAHLFGVLQPGEELQPSALGKAVLTELLALPAQYPTVRLDAWVLMPNHLHVIMVLTQNRVVALSQVVGSFKSQCYRHWRSTVLATGQPTAGSCWQRNYYEHIIRNPAELEAYRHYIHTNPSRWQ